MTLIGHTRKAKAAKQRKPMTLEQARALYVHRFTMEFKPHWANMAAPNGKYYAPQFASDAEWFEHTLFPPNNPLSRTDCHTSGQTWPMGQWLDSPYRREVRQ